MLSSCNQVYILQHLKWNIVLQSSGFVSCGKFSGFSFTYLTTVLKAQHKEEIEVNFPHLILFPTAKFLFSFCCSGCFSQFIV